MEATNFYIQKKRSSPGCAENHSHLIIKLGLNSIFVGLGEHSDLAYQHAKKRYVLSPHPHQGRLDCAKVRLAEQMQPTKQH